ncbi:hypothetical protein [Mesorhizobium sp. Root157]|uniref:hypothetical protein n=1 Tax=Mesorhizobium sp. Root157 TaxID=1736477 RepID=UPI00138F0EAE|nr:hypothetical protein [Mesorhizobium sp. Root157]
MTVLAPEITKATGMLDGKMLKNQNTHEALLDGVGSNGRHRTTAGTVDIEFRHSPLIDWTKETWGEPTSTTSTGGVGSKAWIDPSARRPSLPSTR